MIHVCGLHSCFKFIWNFHFLTFFKFPQWFIAGLSNKREARGEPRTHEKHIFHNSYFISLKKLLYRRNDIFDTHTHRPKSLWPEDFCEIFTLILYSLEFYTFHNTQNNNLFSTSTEQQQKKKSLTTMWFRYGWIIIFTNKSVNMTLIDHKSKVGCIIFFRMKRTIMS
jgi:hypothetical protein